MKAQKQAKPAIAVESEKEHLALQAETNLPTATALTLWAALAQAHWAVAQVANADIERHGLSPAEFGILNALYRQGPLLLGEVQKQVLVSSGGITFLVDRLAMRALVERRDCPSDRRARYAALTKQGETLMRQILPEHAAAIREAVAGLNLTEQTALIDVLGTLGTEAARRAAETPNCKKAIAEMEAAAASERHS